MTARTAAVRGDVEPREEACSNHQPKAGDVRNDREATAVSLAERIALDPHTVDDAFFADVRKHFSDDEIVEMVFACGIFNWGNKFNITMHMDTGAETEYGEGMEYRQEALA
jgi:alkylhydroperoxidase family enzyme